MEGLNERYKVALKVRSFSSTIFLEDEKTKTNKKAQ